ncbi:hypothetical protein [Pedobacter cryophilus]|uniref:Uncharacterized protein n=1 Tax=Pedobacter cryophilus TaxID=2571271 RepID=A0A4U1C1C1_9SPHI|nr:hypothetical protein [Pedobacter cryophilus]TKB96847.1 hypothetical protein FA046_12275 [Pedobacter cryophilus]
MKSKIGIFALVAGIGLLVYYFIKEQKNKKDSKSIQEAIALTEPEVVKTPPSSTVAENIKKAAKVNLNNLTQAQVEQFAKWIDSIIADLKTANQSIFGSASKTVQVNSGFLIKLSGSQLIRVVNQWQKARNLKIQDSLIYKSNILDVTGSISKLKKKIIDIGFNP